MGIFKKKRSPIDPAYKDAIYLALIAQIITGISAALMLDGGRCFQYWEISMAAFWGSLIVILLRNWAKASKIDILYIKFFFVPMLIITPLISNVVLQIINKDF